MQIKVGLIGGCDEYEILGCTDDGMQDWSPFPGNMADNFDPDANTDDGSCLYWGCGNENNNLNSYWNLYGRRC